MELGVLYAVHKMIAKADVANNHGKTDKGRKKKKEKNLTILLK